MDQEPWQTALLQAAQWLQQIAHLRSELGQNKASFAALKQSLPDAPEMHLAVHAPPASDVAELDVLLHLKHGTLALGWQANDALAWSVQQADHWAANLVLSVDDTHTTLQSALLYLNSLARSQPDIMENLVQRAILAQAMRQQTLPEIDPQAIEREVEKFRQRQGLCSAQAMQKWLQETQLTMQALHELIANNLQAQAFRQKLVEPDIEAYFMQQQNRYIRYTVLQVSGLHSTQAQFCAEAWRASGVCPLLEMESSPEFANVLPVVKMETRFLYQLPKQLAECCNGAAVRTIHGPFPLGGQSAVAQVMRIMPAVLDAATREAIAQTLFERWMAAQRDLAKVVWHWM